MMDERLAIWTLAGLKGMGPVGIKRLVDRYGSANEFIRAYPDKNDKGYVSAWEVMEGLKSKGNRDNTETIMLRSIPAECDLVVITDERYPEKLKNIPDPPPFLYVRGRLAIFDGPSLAIVGSRKPTDYGRKMTESIAGELASAGVTIVSGLAFGIDACSHQAALEGGGKTAAVFGCGLDYTYPPSHRGLAEKIALTGCLLSEFPKGTKPERFNFPVRNRIISGLSDGVLVVEAAARSGALVTARLALDQGRDVMAVPGSADSELSYGPNDLIKQGAIPVTGVDDILDNFRWVKSGLSAGPKRDTSDLSGEELSIYNLLTIAPTHLDELVRRTNLGPSQIAELLLKLEIKGYILRKPGNFVARA